MGNGIQGFLGTVSEIPQNSGKGTNKHLFNTLGTNWGQGESQLWGILGINSPKIVEFWGGDGDKIFGEFANSNIYHS